MKASIKLIAAGVCTAALNLFAFQAVLADTSIQAADQQDFNTTEPVGGGGVLTREDDEISASLALSELDKKAGYTIWWVVFNEPDECNEGAGGGCGEPDLFDPDVEASVFFAGGFVTGTDGTANVTVALDAGPIPIGADVVIGAGSVIGGEDSCGEGVDCDTGIVPGLYSACAAEVHMVIRTHGKVIPGETHNMISTFLGQCGVTPNNICEDQYFLIFPPLDDCPE